jgi:hypothetical protein
VAGLENAGRLTADEGDVKAGREKTVPDSKNQRVSWTTQPRLPPVSKKGEVFSAFTKF